jgi:hypothetical protein
MKISLLLTPRLVVIISACASAVVLLLLMLGFELGLRQAHDDQVAHTKAHGENVYGAATLAPSNTSSNAVASAPTSAPTSAPINAPNAANRSDADAAAPGPSRGAP